MSISLMTHVWDHYQQKGGRMLLMLALADYANDADQCWPSIFALSEKARLRVRQTQILLRTMADAGEISIAEGEGPHNVNRYTIHRSVLTKQKEGAKKTKKKTPKQGAENAPPAENAPRSFKQEGVHFSTAPEGETVSENAPKPPLINHHGLTTTTMADDFAPGDGIGADAPGGDGGHEHSDPESRPVASPPSSAAPPSPTPVAHLDTVKYLRDVGIAVAPEFSALPLASVQPFVEELRAGGAKPAHIVGHLRRNRTELASTPMAPASEPGADTYQDRLPDWLRASGIDVSDWPDDIYGWIGIAQFDGEQIIVERHNDMFRARYSLVLAPIEAQLRLRGGHNGAA